MLIIPEKTRGYFVQEMKNSIVERLMSIMDYLTTATTPKRLTDIAKELNLSKTTTFRILHALEKGQWVSCNTDTGMYQIGIKILEMGLHMHANTPLVVIVMPYLSELRDVINETVGLSIRIDSERMFVEEIQSNRALRFISPLGTRLPLWAGAIGKVILANLKEAEKVQYIEQLKQRDLPIFPSGKVLDLDNLRAELDKIQKEGFAISFGERESGTTAIASPIFDIHGDVIGALNIAGPTDRVKNDVLIQYCKLLKKTANLINQKMGSK